MRSALYQKEKTISLLALPRTSCYYLRILCLEITPESVSVAKLARLRHSGM
jgi:hypothetical protein